MIVPRLDQLLSYLPEAVTLETIDPRVSVRIRESEQTTMCLHLRVRWRCDCSSSQYIHVVWHVSDYSKGVSS